MSHLTSFKSPQKPHICLGFDSNFELGECDAKFKQCKSHNRGIHFSHRALCSQISKNVEGGTSTQISGLGLTLFKLFHPLPDSAWADGKLAELAEHLGNMRRVAYSRATSRSRCVKTGHSQISNSPMVEHHRSKSTQPNYPSGCLTL